MESEKAKVKVAVRVRPLNKREIELNSKCVVSINDGVQVSIKNPLNEQQTRSFTFDHCFASVTASNEDQIAVYESVGREVLDQAFQGYNACIFAYGQTGSGKSYTILGSSQQPGIVPRLCNELFERIEALRDKKEAQKVEVSYLEIYNENVYDLLNPENGRRSLRVREHNVMGPFVEGLSQLAVRSYDEVASVIVEGNKSRTVASTNMNAESSRSHSVFTIVLTQTVSDNEHSELVRGEKVSKIRLVDLAGSERASKSGATGERLKEGGSINKSLTTLGQVISVLADVASGRRANGTHVPYRDSSLTWLLKDSIGGNSKTAMMATVSPAADNFDESLSTLRYADRAKRIENRAVVNEDANARTIRLLREEISQLRNQLALALSPAVAAPAEQDAARERLELSEALVKELSRTWDDRVRDTERTNRMRAEALDKIGVSTADSGIRVDRHKFYLVNLNADPTYDGLLVYYLRERNLVGSRPSRDSQATTPTVASQWNGAEDEETPDIQLDGVGIEKRHCLILIGSFDECGDVQATDENKVRERVLLEPLGDATVKVNGKRAKRRTVLKHGDRLLLGLSCSFRLQCPADADDVDEHRLRTANTAESDYSSDDADVSDYQPKYTDSVHDALNRHASYANLFEPSRPSDQRKWVAETISTHERAFQRSLRALRDRIRKANKLAKQANFVARKLHVPVTYGVSLQIPADRLRIDDGAQSLAAGALCEPAIIVRAKRSRDSFTSWLVPSTLLRNDQVWSLEKLEFRLNQMCEFYQARSHDLPVTPSPTVSNIHVEFNDGFDPATKSSLAHESSPFQRFEELVHPEVGEPFCDSTEQHTLIGVANIHLQSLFYDMDYEYDAPIVSQQGEIAGKLRVRLARLFRFPPSASSSVTARKVDDGCIELADRNDDWPADDTQADFALPSDAEQSDAGGGESDAFSARLTLGARIGVRVTLVEARGLPASLAHFVFAQYCFYSQADPVVAAQRPSDNTNRTTVRFDHTQNFQMRVSGELKEYFESAALAVQVFGNRVRDADDQRSKLATPLTASAELRNGPRRSASRETADELHESAVSRMKSIEERWMETSRKVQLWVDVLELSEQGEYTPVPVDSFDTLRSSNSEKVVGTGGVYVLRHGHSRRLVVRVAPLAEQTAPTGLSSGSLPVLLDSIAAAQVGCVVCRDIGVQKPLDSYQDVDLGRVRSAWLRRNDARKAHIDDCLRDLDAEKNARNQSADGLASPSHYSEREKELIEQLMMLAEERNSIQCPLANSHVPGAELVWQPPVGLEAHIPLVFLQRTDDDNETDGATGSNCYESFCAEPFLDDSSVSTASSGRFRLIAGAGCSLPKEHRPQTRMDADLAAERDFVPLPIVQTDLLESHNTLFATAQWDAALHESVALNRVSRPNELLFLVLRVVVRLRQPEVCYLMLRKRIAVRVVSALGRDSVEDSSSKQQATPKRPASGLGRLAGLFRRNEPPPPVAAPRQTVRAERPSSTGVIYELVWRIPSILDDVEMNRENLAELAAQSLDDELDRAGNVDDDADEDSDNDEQSDFSDSEDDSPRRRKPKTNEDGDGARQRRSTRYRRLLDSYMKRISEIESLWIVEKVRQELAVKEQLSAKAPPISVSDARKTILSKTSSTPNLYAPVPPAFHRVAIGPSYLSRTAKESKRAESVIDLSGVKRRGRMSAGEQRSGQSVSNASANHGRTARQISVVEEEQNAVCLASHCEAQADAELPTSSSSLSHTVIDSEERTDSTVTAAELETPDGRDTFVMTSVTSSGYDSHTSTLNVSACADAVRNGVNSNDSQSDSNTNTNDELAPIEHANEQDCELRPIDEDESVSSTHGSSDGADALADWMTTGQRCRIAIRPGELPQRATIRFVGKTHFSSQSDSDAVWIGVELESPNGKNDGTVDGVSYFRCKHKHGLFVRPGRLLPLRTDAADLRTEAARRRVQQPAAGSAGARFGSNPNLLANVRGANVDKSAATSKTTRPSQDAVKRKANRD